MISSKTYTLLDLLSNNVDVFKEDIPNGIEIPMIQRDYAQGRDTEKPSQIREKFLRDIHAQLLATQNGEQLFEPLELDFIYGYVSSGKFVPLDGQQRLTTLYLIHWFVFFKDRVLIDHLDVFKKLSYKSRVSSRNFFEKLNIKENLERIYREIQLVEQGGEGWTLTSLIQDQSWFQKSWMDDPTIQSVMRVFIDIDKNFLEISSSTLLDCRPLGFYLMDISDNGMGDSLYIKMNARGKGLTDFENFKALLEGTINSVDTDLHGCFSQGIDGNWLDRAWLFASNIDSTEERSKVAGTYLLGIITSITELIFNKIGAKGKLFRFDEDTIIEVYSESENIAFLVDAMNHICSLKLSDYNDYFEQIYSKVIVEERIRYDGKPNVIEQVLRSEAMESPDKLLFFAWLIYVNGAGKLEITHNMRDYLRICRNYINNINQKNRKDFNLVSDIRAEDFSSILGVFASIFKSKDVYEALSSSGVENGKYIQYEIRKAQRFAFDQRLKPLIQKLEDDNAFRGLLFNIELERYTVHELALIVEDLFSLLAMDDYKEIVMLFISFGYEGTMIAPRTNIGDMLFWGTKEKWHRVMASPDGEIKPILVDLFELMINRNRSLTMADFGNKYWKGLHSSMNKKSLKWYLLEYPKMLSKSLYTINERKWEIPMLELFDISSLNGYHCNPFVFVLRDRPEIKELLMYSECYSQYSDYAKLKLLNGVILSQANHSWVLYNGIDKVGFEELVSHFNLEDIGDGRFRFSCVNLIEDVIPFVRACNELIEVELLEDVMDKS